jgi:hypothetical protein
MEEIKVEKMEISGSISSGNANFSIYDALLTFSNELNKDR